MGKNQLFFDPFLGHQPAQWPVVRFRIWWQQWPTVLRQASQALRKLGAAQSTYFGITSSHANEEIKGSFYLVLVQSLDPVCSWSTIPLPQVWHCVAQVGQPWFSFHFVLKTHILFYGKETSGAERKTLKAQNSASAELRATSSWFWNYFSGSFYEQRNIWEDQDCADLPDPVEEEKHLPMA